MTEDQLALLDAPPRTETPATTVARPHGVTWRGTPVYGTRPVCRCATCQACRGVNTATPMAPCGDCGVDTLAPATSPPSGRAEYYMIHDHLWATAGGIQGFLCIGCLEIRLGRQLTAADFSLTGVNDLSIADTQRFAWSWRTARLVDRLTVRQR
jgi:hypothetical protein